MRRFTLPLTLLALTSSPLLAADQTTLSLRSGEIVVGEIKQLTSTSAVIVHPELGELTIDRERIVAAEPPLSPIEQTPPPAPAPAEPGYWETWKSRVELGFNGSSGNTESANVRFILTLTNDRPDSNTAVTFAFNYSERNGNKTAQRTDLNARHEWRFDHARQFLWISGRVELDEHQTWDARLGTALGVGDKLIDSDATKLNARLGLGASRELGSAGSFTPELAVFALDANHKINATTSAYANFEFNPDFRADAHGDYRSTTKAGCEIALDPATGGQTKLRLGAEHRYDSRQPSDRANVLDYFIVLGFTF